MKKIGATEAWCTVMDNSDEHEREQLHVTLNRIEETGDWNIEALGELLIEFDAIGFDLGVTGFSVPKLDIIMTSGAPAVASDVEDIIAPLPKVAVTLHNDLWKLGNHRILCIDRFYRSHKLYHCSK